MLIAALFPLPRRKENILIGQWVALALENIV
jgi:hypothetical protein